MVEPAVYAVNRTNLAGVSRRSQDLMAGEGLVYGPDCARVYRLFPPGVSVQSSGAS